MNVQKSIGYKLIQHIIGEHYADIVCDLAQGNARGMIYIPIYIQTALKLKKVLPREVLVQLVNEFGGQRLYVSKREHHRDKRAFAKRSIIQYMVNYQMSTNFSGYDN
ncbi:hypothetical protein [Cysteiniphilum sp. JM-1]|uniref:hypothetical protein n=1 Tax=Cysteiniphilum sp. JM-1 TaxID=2610891 RepID=UPI001244B3A4|nr:hypothetical protein [Cysteiniphilum sp. JM-1]